MSKGKILIVDDEQDILEFVSYNLTKEGYVVVKSGSPLEALDICTKTTFDLIILDLMMPEMDGIELCYKIRNEVGLKDVFITFLTARSEDYSLIAGLNAGADDYIKKPIQPRVLVTKINSLMKRMKHAHTDSAIVAETLPNGLVIDREKFVVIHSRCTSNYWNKCANPREETCSDNGPPTSSFIEIFRIFNHLLNARRLTFI